MIKVVTSLGFGHERKVAREVDSLQENGFSVTDIKRVSRDYVFFGEDVTHITYKEKGMIDGTY